MTNVDESPKELNPIPEAAASEQFRLFIAIIVAQEVKTEMEKAQQELARALPQGCVHWAGRDQFHLTLKFLGKVEVRRVEQLTDAVRAACRGFAAMPFRAERLGFFPQGRSPRVIWAGVNDPNGQLSGLQAAVEAATRGFTIEKQEKKFTGHVTLGRAKDIRRREADVLAKLGAAMAGRFFGQWTADRVEIIRSELSAQGSRYTPVAVVPLVNLD